MVAGRASRVRARPNTRPNRQKIDRNPSLRSGDADAALQGPLATPGLLRCARNDGSRIFGESEINMGSYYPLGNFGALRIGKPRRGGSRIRSLNPGLFRKPETTSCIGTAVLLKIDVMISQRRRQRAIVEAEQD